MDAAVEEKAICQAINAKMGKTVLLSPDKLRVSEFTTRGACIDRQHVEYLAARIAKRGFHPSRAISVNVIRGVDGAETAYRVVAGVHRFEAAKHIGLREIPCLLYYDLTDEEECFLDTWDNELDDSHK
jgi:ParB-like chromosome segregation protein Spo0J